MASKFGWRETASLWLCGILLVCLLFALTSEAIDLTWLNQPVGTVAWTIAEVSGWVFGVVLIALFVIVASMDEPKNRRPGTPFRPGHE